MNIINYTATIAADAPSGVDDLQYSLKLKGAVIAGKSLAPIPTTTSLFGSGLISFIGLTRQK